MRRWFGLLQILLNHLWNNEDRGSGGRGLMGSFALVPSKKLEVVGLQPLCPQVGRQQRGSAPVPALLAHPRQALALRSIWYGDRTDCAYSVLTKWTEEIAQSSAEAAGQWTRCGIHVTPVLLLMMPTVNEMKKRHKSIVLLGLIPHQPQKLLFLHCSSILWCNWVL